MTTAKKAAETKAEARTTAFDRGDDSHTSDDHKTPDKPKPAAETKHEPKDRSRELEAKNREDADDPTFEWVQEGDEIVKRQLGSITEQAMRAQHLSDGVQRDRATPLGDVEVGQLIQLTEVHEDGTEVRQVGYVTRVGPDSVVYVTDVYGTNFVPPSRERALRLSEAHGVKARIKHLS